MRRLMRTFVLYISLPFLSIPFFKDFVFGAKIFRSQKRACLLYLTFALLSRAFLSFFEIFLMLLCSRSFAFCDFLSHFFAP